MQCSHYVFFKSLLFGYSIKLTRMIIRNICQGTFNLKQAHIRPMKYSKLQYNITVSVCAKIINTACKEGFSQRCLGLEEPFWVLKKNLSVKCFLNIFFYCKEHFNSLKKIFPPQRTLYEMERFRRCWKVLHGIIDANKETLFERVSICVCSQICQLLLLPKSIVGL